MRTFIFKTKCRKTKKKNFKHNLYLYTHQKKKKKKFQTKPLFIYAPKKKKKKYTGSCFGCLGI